jgi:hypothetical protein
MAFYLGGISVVESEWGAGEGDVEDINDLDFGIILGGGIDYPLGKGILSVDLRYDLGLTKIYAPVYNNSIKNRVFSIFLSYGIK